jgi:AcrR family transcriptional regulator
VTSSAAPPRKARGQGHERRAEILAAAKALFAAEGYAAFTTRKLAAAVGLSQTGLYVYFRSTEEIFDALCRESFAELAAEFRRIDADPPAGLAGLEAFMRAHIAFALAHPDEYRLTFMEGPGLVKMAPGAEGAALAISEQGVAGQTFLLLRGCLERLAVAGLIRSADLTLSAYAVWFAAHGLASTFIARPGYVRADRAELISNLVETVLKGLAA